MPTPPASSSRGPLLWVGLGLMCVGVALTAFLYFLFLISVPIFLLGFGLVMSCGQAPWRKALAVLFPFAAWAGIALSALALAPREQATTFLISEGFEGTIMLVANEPCGPPPEYENGRRLYRVPANGLLITRDTLPNRQHPYYQWPNRGYYLQSDNQYFLVDRQGHRLRELTEVSAASGPTDHPAATSAWRDVGRDEVAAFYDYPIVLPPDSNRIGYVFQYLTITTQNHWERPALWDTQSRVRHLADSLLPLCRTRSEPQPQGLWEPKPNPFDMPSDSTAKQAHPVGRQK